MMSGMDAAAEARAAIAAAIAVGRPISTADAQIAAI
jgi:hypothetical protein